MQAFAAASALGMIAVTRKTAGAVQCTTDICSFEEIRFEQVVNFPTIDGLPAGKHEPRFGDGKPRIRGKDTPGKAFCFSFIQKELPLLPPKAETGKVQKAKPLFSAEGQRSLHMDHGQGLTAKEAQDPGRQGRVQGEQFPGRDAVPLREGIQEGPRLLLQIFLILPQQPRGAQGGLGKAGVQLPQERDDPMPEAVAPIVIREIAAVLHKGDLLRPEIGEDLLPGTAQQRAAQLPAHRRDTGKSGASRAADQVQKQGLGIVVGIVGGGDHVAVQALRFPVQKGIAQRPGGFLQAQAILFGTGRNVSVLHRTGNVVFLTPIPNKGGVPKGFLPPDAVLVMGGKNREVRLIF